jgi:hypothetical protein
MLIVPHSSSPIIPLSPTPIFANSLETKPFSLFPFFPPFPKVARFPPFPPIQKKIRVSGFLKLFDELSSPLFELIPRVVIEK